MLEMDTRKEVWLMMHCLPWQGAYAVAFEGSVEGWTSKCKLSALDMRSNVMMRVWQGMRDRAQLIC